MKKVFIFIVILSLFLFGCGQKSIFPKSETEKMQGNQKFTTALDNSLPFVNGGVTFKFESAQVNMSPNEDSPTKTIKVYVDYPYEIKTVEYLHFSIIDVDNTEYEAVLSDGLDWMGKYRQEGKAGKVTFILPAAYNHFLLKVKLDAENPTLVYFQLD